MRVLCFNQYFSTPQAAGGSRAYEFARRLVANGHQVTVITTPAFLPPEFTGPARVERRQVEGIDLVVLQVPYSNLMGFGARMRAFLNFALGAAWEARRYEPDVLFATSTPLTIAIPAILAKLLKRRPLVFEVRDLWPEVPIAMGVLKNRVAIFAARALEYAAYKASARVIALSPGMAEGVINRGYPRDRVSIIPNSCDTDTLRTEPSVGLRFRERLGIAADDRVIAYAGTFGRVNGVGYLLTAAAAMASYAPDVKFLLVGGGLEFEECRRRAHDLGLLNRSVWVLPAVPKADMPAVLGAATVVTSVVIPIKELWNNSANKFFDGLAAAKPVAINHGGWQADILRQSGAGIELPAGDPVAAARLLADFVRDHQRVADAAGAARRLAHGPLNREVLAHQFESVLKAVAGQADDNAIPAQRWVSVGTPELGPP